MNETIELMLNRRTIRKYKAEQIKEDELAAVLDAGRKLSRPVAAKKSKRHGDLAKNTRQIFM